LRKFSNNPLSTLRASHSSNGCYRSDPFAIGGIRCNGERNAPRLHENYAIAGFTFVLIILFALAVFQDYRWRKIEPPLHTVGSENKTHFPPKSADSDDKVTSSALYSLYTALSARGLGTAEQLITVRGEKQQNFKVD